MISGSPISGTPISSALNLVVAAIVIATIHRLLAAPNPGTIWRLSPS